jgi:hypothetical protein
MSHVKQAEEYRDLLEAMKKEGDEEDYEKSEKEMDEFLRRISRKYVVFRTRRDGRVYRK